MIAYDLAFLRAVLNWATMGGDGDGGYLLEKNPLKGLPLPRELNPQSHAIGLERYRALLDVGTQVSPFFRPMAVLAYETGRRIGAIRLLRWADIDFEGGRIRWRAENDKTGREAYTPLPEAARRELAGLERRIGEVWVFPSPGDPEKPCSRHLVRDWWYKAEEVAGVEHLPRTAWHGLRRQFATELARRGVGLATIAAIGGWKEPQTITRHYIRRMRRRCGKPWSSESSGRSDEPRVRKKIGANESPAWVAKPKRGNALPEVVDQGLEPRTSRM
jgi:integrase